MQIAPENNRYAQNPVDFGFDYQPDGFQNRKSKRNVSVASSFQNLKLSVQKKVSKLEKEIDKDPKTSGRLKQHLKKQLMDTVRSNQSNFEKSPEPIIKGQSSIKNSKKS